MPSSECIPDLSCALLISRVAPSCSPLFVSQSSERYPPGAPALLLFKSIICMVRRRLPHTVRSVTLSPIASLAWCFSFPCKEHKRFKVHSSIQNVRLTPLTALFVSCAEHAVQDDNMRAIFGTSLPLSISGRTLPCCLESNYAKDEANVACSASFRNRCFCVCEGWCSTGLVKSLECLHKIQKCQLVKSLPDALALLVTRAFLAQASQNHIL